MTFRSEDIAHNPREILEAQISMANRGESVIWLDRPFNLYLLERQADSYLGLMRSAVYGEGFHATIRTLIEENSAALLAGLRPPLDLIDLGPGYPDKTLPLLSRMCREGIRGRYVPVDISCRFLNLAAETCCGFGLSVQPLHLLFEELPARLGAIGPSRLIIFGVTFMNYEPDIACRLLSQLMRPGDIALIAVELLRQGCLESAMAPYRSEEARAFNFIPLDILGIPAASVEYFVQFERGRIEMGFELTRSVRTQACRLDAGRRIMTSFSCRSTMTELQTLIAFWFSTVEIHCDAERSCAVIRLGEPRIGALGVPLPRIKNT
jgi:hypothetical protein